MTTNTTPLTDEQRQARRDADRQRTREAVQALRGARGGPDLDADPALQEATGGLAGGGR